MRRVVWVCLLSACAPDILVDAAPHTVRALWDPSQGVMPLPTDLVRREGRLALPIDEGMPAAERELRTYLNELDGYPVSIPISIPFSGALDPQSLADGVRIFDLTDGSELALDVSFDDQRLEIKAQSRADLDASQPAPQRLSGARRYLYIATGYGRGVLGAADELVVADAAFSFVRGTKPLTEHLDAFPGETELERRESAQALENVRLFLRPLFEAARDHDIARPQVAVLGSFTTSSRPAVWFDPTTRQIPLPNNLLLDRSTLRVTLPETPADSLEMLSVKRSLSRYDGFSTTAPLVMTATDAVQQAAMLSPDAVRVFRIDDGSFSEVIDLERGVLSDGTTFWVRPRLCLEPNATYAYVVTREAQAATGAPLEAQLVGAFVRSQAPLLVDGESQVGSLSNAQALALEPTRAELAPLLDFLTTFGIERKDLAAAVPFRTLSPELRLMELRDELYTRDVPTHVSHIVEATPWDRGLWAIMPNVETVVTGKLTTFDHLDAVTHAFSDDDSGVERPVDFVLTIPPDVSGKIPVVVFGHGLETSRELVYMIADDLAQHGFASFSIDLPLHGNRAICSTNLECSGSSTCRPDGSCREADGSLSSLVSISSPWDSGPSYPLTSGLYFIDPSNILGSRDHFLQALVDLMQGVRVIKRADWQSATGYELDGDDIVYVGMSLGSILGATLAGIEPEIESFALNVGGGDLVKLMRESTFFAPIIEAGMNDRNIEMGSIEYFHLENALRWLFDQVDPLNVAFHAVREPLSYRDHDLGVTKLMQKKRVLLQMAEGDLVVPNVGTQALAERMHLPLSVYSPLISNHGFLFDPTSFEGADARDEIMGFLDAR